MTEASMILEALLYSLQVYERIIGHVTIFVCSREIFELLDEPEFVLGKIVEIDEQLYGFTSNAWRWQ